MARLILVAVVAFGLGGVCGYLIAPKGAPVGDTPKKVERKRADVPGGRPGGDLPAAGKAGLGTTADKLEEIRRTMDRFFRDPVAKAQAAVNRLVDEHNQWVKARNAAHQVQREALERRLADVRRSQAQIEKLDQHLAQSKPSLTDKSAVEAYNALVALRNSLVVEYKKLGKLCADDAKALRESVERTKQDVSARKADVEAAKRRVEEELEACRRWFAAGKDSAFWADLHAFYARLHQARRRAGSSAELDACIAEVRGIRRELGARAIRQQAQAGGKLILVPGRLSGGEDCVFIVDTGATRVTIPPSLVTALGWSDRVGNEVEISLAGGVRIRAPELLIPELSVYARGARDVAGVVLKAPEVGVDGLLGMSFLDRFAYRIDREQEPKLILQPRGQ